MFLLPPDMKQWLPEDHLVYFVMDVVSQLDLGAIYRCYDSRKGGQPPFDPRMMVALLYLVMTLFFARLVAQIERKMSFVR